MIRNIPIKFSQIDMLSIINQKFQNSYDYFYLPKDSKTQSGVGFAFINMAHPMLILEFYLEFNCIKWSDRIENCNSNKLCAITYANVQGLQAIKAELSDKSIMKREEDEVKPLFFENNSSDLDHAFISEIKKKFQNDSQLIQMYRQKLSEF